MVAEYSVWQQGVEVNYAALCEEKKDGLHILRLMGQTSVVYIPQMIDGYEVKVIGEYCFSARNNCKNRTSDNDWEKMEKLARDRGMSLAEIMLNRLYCQTVCMNYAVTHFIIVESLNV